MQYELFYRISQHELNEWGRQGWIVVSAGPVRTDLKEGKFVHDVVLEKREITDG